MQILLIFRGFIINNFLNWSCSEPKNNIAHTATVEKTNTILSSFMKHLSQSVGFKAAPRAWREYFEACSSLWNSCFCIFINDLYGLYCNLLHLTSIIYCYLSMKSQFQILMRCVCKETFIVYIRTQHFKTIKLFQFFIAKSPFLYILKWNNIWTFVYNVVALNRMNLVFILFACNQHKQVKGTRF